MDEKKHLDLSDSASNQVPVAKTENSHGLFENYTSWLLALDIFASRP